MSNIVYIGTSLDGYISAADGSMDWMNYVPIPKDDDMGFSKFMERIDAVVMGRKTFETILGFDVGWQYRKSGIILSTTLKSVPEEFDAEVQLASGSPREIVQLAESQGFDNLYIDGGRTIQQFLREDLIDEMIITEIPLLLGGGDRLFGSLDQQLGFELADTEVLLNQLLRKRYIRKRE